MVATAATPPPYISFYRIHQMATMRISTWFLYMALWAHAICSDQKWHLDRFNRFAKLMESRSRPPTHQLISHTEGPRNVDTGMRRNSPRICTTAAVFFLIHSSFVVYFPVFLVSCVALSKLAATLWRTFV